LSAAITRREQWTLLGTLALAGAWFLLIGWHVLAKIFEGADVPVWRATGEFVSGHTLKHLAAATGGWVLAREIARLRGDATAVRRV
jgi:ethanolamine transporter EutH